MANVLDAVYFQAINAGVDPFEVGEAVQGFMTPADAGALDGVMYNYRAESDDKTEWEIGAGVYESSTGVLDRTSVLYSSDNNERVDFTNPPKVRIVALAENMPVTGNLYPYILCGETSDPSTDITGRGQIWWGYDPVSVLYVTDFDINGNTDLYNNLYDFIGGALRFKLATGNEYFSRIVGGEQIDNYWKIYVEWLPYVEGPRLVYVSLHQGYGFKHSAMGTILGNGSLRGIIGLVAQAEYSLGSQQEYLTLYGATSDDTPTVLTSDAQAANTAVTAVPPFNVFHVLELTVTRFTCTVIAIENNTRACKHWKLEGTVRGHQWDVEPEILPEFISEVVPVVVDADPETAGWSVAVSIEEGGEGGSPLLITVTGGESDSISWLARLESTCIERGFL